MYNNNPLHRLADIASTTMPMYMTPEQKIEYNNLQDWEIVNQTLHGFNPEVLAAANNDTLAATRLQSLGGPSNLINILKGVRDRALEEVRRSRPNARPEDVEYAAKNLSSARMQLGDKNTRNQCEQTIGKASFERENFVSLVTGNQGCIGLLNTSSNLDVLGKEAGTPIRTGRCWLCGLPLGPRDQRDPHYLAWAAPQCEHVLPVAIATTFFALYQDSSDKKLSLLKKNYSWAHASCNAFDKGHFDANSKQPLLNYNMSTNALSPRLDTYALIVNGWNRETGIKNRLAQELRCFGQINFESIELWAQSRISVILNSYTRLCTFLNQNLQAAPELYSLATIAHLLETQVAEITKHVDKQYRGGKKKKIKSKKRKVKRKKKKTKKTKKTKKEKTKKKK